MEIKIIENTVDTIVANVGPTQFNGSTQTITVAEYWKDEDKFVIYDEIFDADGSYIDDCDQATYSDDECKEIENYLRNY